MSIDRLNPETSLGKPKVNFAPAAGARDRSALDTKGLVVSKNLNRSRTMTLLHTSA